ncbi:MAG: CotH kinase family protein, partial [Bacteroidota bacterium]
MHKSKSTKLPFNLKANYRIKKQRFAKGVKTLKLSNVFRDPSFLREVLSYEIAGDYMAAPRANYVRVYVNDDYLGLYNNTESVDGNFLDRYFGEHDGIFFKCDPVWSSHLPKGCNPGEKASLLYQGKDTICYEKNYEIKSDHGWSALQSLTKTLNSTPIQIEQQLNVDEVLWMLAFNNVLVNLDSYTGRLCHNYYLYQDTFGIFHPIVWDMNLSFGGFRFAGNDKSLSNEEMQKLSPFVHYKYEKRPLISQLLNIDLYRKIYVAHLKTILEEQLLTNKYLDRAKQVQQVIDTYVKSDDNKLYSYDAFRQNLQQSADANKTSIVGITELMQGRIDYLKAHPILKKEAPAISEVAHQKEGENIVITASAPEAKQLYLSWRNGKFGPFTRVAMDKDSEKDGRFTLQIPTGDCIHYYLIAEGDKVASVSPARAAFEFY